MPTKLNKQDIELFKQAVKDVKPLVCDKVALSPKKTTKSRHSEQSSLLSKPISDYEKNTIVGAETYIQFIRPGVQKGFFTKLQQGKISMRAELDLHGLTSEQAWVKLEEFIQRCTAKKLRTVRIIHGKGYRSPNAPVLKNKIYQWLKQLPVVLAFCSAKSKDGGSGAVYVLLKTGN